MWMVFKQTLDDPDYMPGKGIIAGANETFEKFSYSHKKEYVEWIVEAKTDATREKRLAQAMEMMSEGKSRMWKYQK